MKKWTVMLIPHSRGGTQMLNLSAYQLWVVVFLLIAFAFTSGFFFSRHRAMAREYAQVRNQKQALEFRVSEQAATVGTQGLTARERIELENRLRTEYEASIAKITAELSDLHELETEARRLTGIGPAPRTRTDSPASSRGGKGGGASRFDEVAYEENPAAMTPDAAVYGLSRPSADLLIQEINLRTASLSGLVTELKARESQLAAAPSIWPVASARRYISSVFGYRKDPYNLRIRHHDGVDIVAPAGSAVVATGDGTVISSGYDGDLGFIVRIDHGNGTETWYAHLQAALVGAGDRVRRNTVIGKVGSTGRSTGPHLHYEVHQNGDTVNPAKYLRD